MAPALQTIDRAFRDGIDRHRAGDVDRAAAVYEEVLQQNPQHAGAWHLLGVTWQQRGDPRRAVECIRRAIALDDSKAVYHNNLGVAIKALGHLGEAIAAYRRAVAISPRYADAWSNLGATLHEEGHSDEAREALRRALQLQPDHPDALYNLANLCQDQGQGGEAVRLYKAAIQGRPDWAEAHNNLGNALLAERRTGEAISAYQRAIDLEPGFAEAHLNLGIAWAEAEEIERAERCFQTAAGLRPDKPIWSMRSLGLCPVVFPSGEELRKYRCRLEERLDACLATPLEVEWRDLTVDGLTPSFHLDHHGRSNRRLKEKFAWLFAPNFPQRRPPVGSGKPRIGFLVTRDHVGGFLRGMAGIIERLERRRFELVVLASESVLDRCRREIRRDEVDYVGLPQRFSAAVERTAAARCDVLYHWQVGSDPLNYFLPFARPAAVQCIGFGMHGTTGVAAVDYAVSSSLFEPDGAQEHYTERLYAVSTVPSYERRIAAPPQTERSRFGLPERGTLYVCPQRVSKFHPDFDPLLRGVLESDPEGRLVLLEGRQAGTTEQLRWRFERTLGRSAGRVLFMPPQAPADFYRLLSLADVALDVPQYSSALTGYDAFALDLPVVTLPGRLMVERYVLGFYRKMGVEGPIAASAEEYVALAVRLGTDRDYRESVRAAIARQSGVLFEDAQVVSQYEEFFEFALAQAGRVCP